MKKCLFVLFVSFPFVFFALACSNTVSSSDDLENFPLEGEGGSETISSSSLSSSSVDSLAEKDSVDSLGFSWVKIPATKFIRGETEVSVSEFRILSTEITQKMYGKYLELPTQKKNGDSLPVANVSWYDAARFCNALAKAYGLDTAYVYESVGTAGVLLSLEIKHPDSTVRLPTEAEWEIAARAGTSTKYYWGSVENAHLYANYYSESGVISVGSLLPNRYGLYDMAGNVSEWVEDWYSAYAGGTKEEDPAGPAKGSEKVFRGGSWSSSATELASDNRQKAKPTEALYNRGFRIVLKI